MELPLPLRYTPWHVILNVRYNHNGRINDNYEVSGSCHFLLRVLFNVPSRYYVLSVSKTYLELEVDVPRIPVQYSVNSTLELVNIFLIFLT